MSALEGCLPEKPESMPPIPCFYNWDGVCKRDGADVQIEEGQCESCSDFCVESWRLEQYYAQKDAEILKFESSLSLKEIEHNFKDTGIMDGLQSIISPVYSIPGNIRRKLAAYQKAFDALKKMEWYYAPIFSRDPEVQELLQLLDGKIVQLKQQLESHYKALAECNPPEHTESDKEDAIDLAIYEDAMAEYRKNPVSHPITELWEELDLEELKDLYRIAKDIDPTNALNLIRQAESEEERNFFAYIADMNLQRKQKEAIEKNVF